jgi:hypothetical protein
LPQGGKSYYNILIEEMSAKTDNIPVFCPSVKEGAG